MLCLAHPLQLAASKLGVTEGGIRSDLRSLRGTAIPEQLEFAA